MAYLRGCMIPYIGSMALIRGFYGSSQRYTAQLGGYMAALRGCVTLVDIFRQPRPVGDDFNQIFETPRSAGV